MNLSDINELDFNNIGSWPTAARGVLIGIVFVAVLGLGYWFDTQNQIDTLHQAQAHEQALKNVFQAKAAKAANLKAYQVQLKNMRHSFGAMLRRLPNRTEVADLLVDISQTGLASGLHFELFKPQAEVPKDFYAELPISIRVRGTYHQFGAFISGVAALPRIVTVHNINIKPAHDKSGKGPLVMNLTAKTYRYIERQGNQHNRHGRHRRGGRR